MSWNVLLVAHGTVDDLEDLPEFLKEIRRGRPPTPELIQEMRERYEAVGGSPLLRETQAQAQALEGALGVPCRVAMRLWRPRVGEVLKDLEPGTRVCVLPLAPFSVEVYVESAKAAVKQAGLDLELSGVGAWGEEPLLLDAMASGIEEKLAGESDSVPVILSAHSLPMRVIQSGDRYAELFEAAAEKVKTRLQRAVEICYQSQGAMAGEWLGPDLPTTMEKLQKQGHSRIAIAPIGFFAEHIETLYDLDIEAVALGKKMGLEVLRVPTVGSSDGYIQALAKVAREAMDAAG